MTKEQLGSYKMKTLRELVDHQHLTHMSDEEIIVAWLMENNLAEMGIRIISQLATSKIKEQQETLSSLYNDVILSSTGDKHLIEWFGIDNGYQILRIIKLWEATGLIGKDFEEEQPLAVKWLKEFVPTQKQPLVILQSFVKWLNEREIYFKDQKKKRGM